MVQGWVNSFGDPGSSLRRPGHVLATLSTLDRLAEALAALHRSLPAACRLNPRKKHPNTCQLLLNPSLLDLA